MDRARRAPHDKEIIMSRKLLLSSISIAATAALLGAGVFAKYSDTEQSATATVTAGSLNLVVGGSAASTDFSVSNAYPGYDTGTAFGYVLSNTGTLPGVLHVYLVKDSDQENSLVEPETDVPDLGPTGEIDNFLSINVDGNSFGYGGTVPWIGLETAAIGQRVDITSMIWGGPAITIPAGGQYPAAPFELWFGWKISPDAGNGIMSDSLGFHLEFTLDQV
jgi:predicted ribosomally synthesized peptide with SipW-like signal peptide